ncbi:hypothetical protein C0991_003860 [Blastosporella zonata]|nr:hypothetical protein C0991_003860 [Blastosporella zonata]
MPIIAAPIEAVAVLGVLFPTELLKMLMFAHPEGFVMAGIPVFYLTRKSADDRPRIFLWVSSCWSRIWGRPSEEGWEAVATDVDEPIEMVEGHPPRDGFELWSRLISRSSQEHTYKFDVKMTCSGCSGAVTRVLEKAKAEGVSDFTVNLDKQEVVVKSILPYDDVLARIKKTGKEVRSGITVE